MTPRRVKQLRAGQRFLWCGRVVTFTRAESHRRNKRPGRQLVVVEDTGLTRSLHYYDDEKVEVVTADVEALP